MDAYSAQLSFELVEIIISEFWYSEHDSDVRIVFMTGFPLVRSLWRDIPRHIRPNRQIPLLPQLYHPFQKVFHLPSFSSRIYLHHHMLC